MSEVTSTPPLTQKPGWMGTIIGGVIRAIFEILVFIFAGPFFVATVLAALALGASAVKWITTGQTFLPAPSGGDTAMIVAIYLFSYFYLLPGYFFAGAVYAVTSRLLAPTLPVALLSGLVGISAFWLLTNWSVPTTGGSYPFAPNALFAGFLALISMPGCWWLVRPRRAALTN